MEAALRHLEFRGLARIVAGAALLLQVVPVAAGLLYIVMPSLGHLPALGRAGFSLEPLAEALTEPGLWRSVTTTIVAGVPSSLAALMLGILLAATIAPDGNVAGKKKDMARNALQMVVAVPPAAFAIGFAFVVAPSGWLARILAPLFDWHAPPVPVGLWPVPRDPNGMALGLALVLKETPFLTMAALAALHQMRPGERMRSAIGLGYDPVCAWIKVVLPELAQRMRWPFFAVLAYGLSAVDLASLLGPTAPPPLAVVIADMGRDPDLGRRFPAACLALLEIGLVLVVWLCCWTGARALAAALRPWLVAGAREIPRLLTWAGRLMAGLAVGSGVILVVMALGDLALWSIASAWRYPDRLPECCAIDNWHRLFGEFLIPMLWSVGIALGSTIAAMVAAIFYLGQEGDVGIRERRWAWNAIFLPLVMPDIAFLLGTQIMLLTLNWRAGWLPVLWSHFLFVFPYVLLVLADSWRRLDPRYERIAACLGQGPWRRLIRVRLQLLKPALLLAGALGIAVSLSLYLPTFLLSGGRLSTLATEAVALGSGGDRRVISVLAGSQAMLAWLFFALAAIASQDRRWDGGR